MMSNFAHQATAMVRHSPDYTAVELRTGVFAGEETPVLNQSEV
jgi:hypothetical protein